MRDLTQMLRKFIRHCPECLALQTKRHLPYGFLQPIESPSVLFYILILDFIFALPLTPKELNALMSVTCKFSKCITFIEGIDIWSAKQLAHAFLKRLHFVD